MGSRRIISLSPGEEDFPSEDEDEADEFSLLKADHGLYDSGNLGCGEEGYDEDDEEADKIWDYIDSQMDSRRRSRREARLNQEIKRVQGSNPLIPNRGNLKRELNAIPEQDWDNIKDYSIKKRKTTTPITDLDIPDGNSNANARILLKYLTHSNPQHPRGWVAAARQSVRKQEARKVINKGLIACPESEDLWLEACNCSDNRDEARAVIARGLKLIPKSVVLWRRAVELENGAEDRKSKVFERLQVCLDGAEEFHGEAREMMIPTKEETAVLTPDEDKVEKDFASP